MNGDKWLFLLRSCKTERRQRRKSRQRQPNNPFCIISLNLLPSHRAACAFMPAGSVHTGKEGKALFLSGGLTAPRQVSTVMHKERDSIFMNPVINKSSLQSLRLLLLPLGPPATAAQRRGSKNPSGVEDRRLGQHHSRRQSRRPFLGAPSEFREAKELIPLRPTERGKCATTTQPPESPRSGDLAAPSAPDHRLTVVLFNFPPRRNSKKKKTFCQHIWKISTLLGQTSSNFTKKKKKYSWTQKCVRPEQKPRFSKAGG